MSDWIEKLGFDPKGVVKAARRDGLVVTVKRPGSRPRLLPAVRAERFEKIRLALRRGTSIKRVAKAMHVSHREVYAAMQPFHDWKA